MAATKMTKIFGGRENFGGFGLGHFSGQRISGHRKRGHFRRGLSSGGEPVSTPSLHAVPENRMGARFVPKSEVFRTGRSRCGTFA
jgi:hypothetical protein